MTAIATLTVQNTTGVKKIIPINHKIIGDQILFSSKDIKPDYIKIGFHSSKVMNSVFRALKRLNIKNNFGSSNGS